jgi:hypothetical protein
MKLPEAWAARATLTALVKPEAVRVGFCPQTNILWLGPLSEDGSEMACLLRVSGPRGKHQ